MAARRVRVCVQYIWPVPCPFWPPSPPTWIPAVAGIYMFPLDYLLLFQTCRVAMLFRGLGRFLPCLSPSFSFSALPSASILLLIFFLPSPFFATWFFFLSFILFPSVLLVSCMCTWLNRIARRDKRTEEERGKAAVWMFASIFFLHYTNSVYDGMQQTPIVIRNV